MERSYRLLKREKIDTIAIHCQSQIDNFLTHFFAAGRFGSIFNKTFFLKLFRHRLYHQCDQIWRNFATAAKLYKSLGKF